MDGSLFPRRPDYSNPKFPAPRAFQDRAHQALRDGFRSGHRKQLLVAPTGAGKTYIGLRIVHESLAKGKRACFVCDRTAHRAVARNSFLELSRRNEINGDA